jgi:hypothetical protein
MRLKFFTIPLVDPERAEAELNRFLAAHQVNSIESPV